MTKPTLGRAIAAATILALVGTTGASFALARGDKTMPGAPAPAGSTIVDVAVKAGSFKTLVAALQAADLVTALGSSGPFTVFAPTDEAFAKLPAGTVESLLKPENKDKLAAILKYHVVSGQVTSSQIGSVPVAATLEGQLVKPVVKDGIVRINKAQVTKADIMASNGVIHVIDQVLLPESRTIPALAKDSGKFNTLLAAVGAAGLAETLGGPGPFTVFAPTDDAFAKLPKPLLEALLKPENKDKLTAILTYHVVKGRIDSISAVKAGTAPSLQGTDVKITDAAGKVMINDSTVVIADIDSANGVIHAIDRVLIPAALAPELSKLSMTTPRKMIELAIDRGVPLFNHGNPGACAAVYEVAINGLMALPETSMSDCQRATLAEALGQGAATHSASDRAWIYRRSLDSVMASTDKMASR